MYVFTKCTLCCREDLTERRLELLSTEQSKVECKSFVGFLLVFSLKTVNTQESAALVLYPEYVVLLNSSALFR